MIKVKLREVLWEKNISAAEINRATGLNKANLSNISWLNNILRTIYE